MDKETLTQEELNALAQEAVKANEEKAAAEAQAAEEAAEEASAPAFSSLALTAS